MRRFRVHVFEGWPISPSGKSGGGAPPVTDARVWDDSYSPPLLAGSFSSNDRVGTGTPGRHGNAPIGREAAIRLARELAAKLEREGDTCAT